MSLEQNTDNKGEVDAASSFCMSKFVGQQFDIVTEGLKAVHDVDIGQWNASRNALALIFEEYEQALARCAELFGQSCYTCSHCPVCHWRIKMSHTLSDMPFYLSHDEREFIMSRLACGCRNYQSSGKSWDGKEWD